MFGRYIRFNDAGIDTYDGAVAMGRWIGRIAVFQWIDRVGATDRGENVLGYEQRADMRHYDTIVLVYPYSFIFTVCV